MEDLLSTGLIPSSLYCNTGQLESTFILQLILFSLMGQLEKYGHTLEGNCHEEVDFRH